jgi:hypothetical protein
MIEIKRLNIDTDTRDSDIVERPSPDGEYVRWADYFARVKQLEAGKVDTASYIAGYEKVIIEASKVRIEQLEARVRELEAAVGVLAASYAELQWVDSPRVSDDERSRRREAWRKASCALSNNPIAAAAVEKAKVQ